MTYSPKIFLKCSVYIFFLESDLCVKILAGILLQLYRIFSTPSFSPIWQYCHFLLYDVHFTKFSVNCASVMIKSMIIFIVISVLTYKCEVAIWIMFWRLNFLEILDITVSITMKRMLLPDCLFVMSLSETCSKYFCFIFEPNLNLQ